MGGRGASSASFNKAMGSELVLPDGRGGGRAEISKKIPSAYFQTLEGNRVSAQKTLTNTEGKIIKNDYETGVIIDNDGFVQAAYKGGKTSVNFGRDSEKMKGNIVTHNHPSGVPLPSRGDILTAGTYGAKEIRMATIHGTGSLKVLSSGGSIPKWNRLAFDYNKMIGTGTSALKAYKWLTKNARNYGLAFSVTKKR